MLCQWYHYKTQSPPGAVQLEVEISSSVTEPEGPSRTGQQPGNHFGSTWSCKTQWHCDRLALACRRGRGRGSLRLRVPRTRRRTLAVLCDSAAGVLKQNDALACDGLASFQCVARRLLARRVFLASSISNDRNALFATRARLRGRPRATSVRWARPLSPSNSIAQPLCLRKGPICTYERLKPLRSLWVAGRTCSTRHGGDVCLLISYNLLWYLVVCVMMTSFKMTMISLLHFIWNAHMKSYLHDIMKQYMMSCQWYHITS
jgi:hypothetical protein